MYYELYNYTLWTRADGKDRDAARHRDVPWPRLTGHAPSGLAFLILGLGAALVPVAPAELLTGLDGPGEWLLDYRAEQVSWVIQEQDIPALDRWLRVGIGEERTSTIFSGIHLHRNWTKSRRLIAAGADPDVRNENGRTQLMRADADNARLCWSGAPIQTPAIRTDTPR